MFRQDFGLDKDHTTPSESRILGKYPTLAWVSSLLDNNHTVLSLIIMVSPDPRTGIQVHPRDLSRGLSFSTCKTVSGLNRASPAPETVALNVYLAGSTSLAANRVKAPLPAR